MQDCKSEEQINPQTFRLVYKSAAANICCLLVFACMHRSVFLLMFMQKAQHNARRTCILLEALVSCVLENTNQFLSHALLFTLCSRLSLSFLSA